MDKELTLDEVAEKEGGYLKNPIFPTVFEYDVRALTDYCIKHDLNLENPPIDVLKKFTYKNPIVYA